MACAEFMSENQIVQNKCGMAVASIGVAAVEHRVSCSTSSEETHGYHQAQ